jgi:DNA-binding response OmpR family regulator
MGANRKAQDVHSGEIGVEEAAHTPGVILEGTAVTVLVVDDDDDVRDSTAAILRREGFVVLEAADGAAATWTLASAHVDVLLLDLQLGRLDGTAVLDALEESSTVVVFSAFGEFHETEIRERFGAVVFDCLRKPVPPPHLVEVVLAAAARAREQGHEAEVRPIAPWMALRLAMAGLARMTPQSERQDHAPTPDGEARPTKS